MLKGQDLLVAFHLAGRPAETLAGIGQALLLSGAEVHNSLQRLQASQLVLPSSRSVQRAHLSEFAIHGARYSFPAEIGRMARGIPTAQSAEPLSGLLAIGDEGHLVWRDPDGSLRAQTLEPIYHSAPRAALADKALHRKLALLDGIRAGSARIRQLAIDLLAKELSDAGR